MGAVTAAGGQEPQIDEAPQPPSAPSRRIGAADLDQICRLANDDMDAALIGIDLIKARLAVTETNRLVRSGAMPVTADAARTLTAMCVRLEEALAQLRATLRQPA